MSDYGFDITRGDYRFRSKESLTEKGMSVITIWRKDQQLKEFIWPSYKIWNIYAHAEDIMADIEEGLSIAGSTGFGGNVYKAESTDEKA